MRTYNISVVCGIGLKRQNNEDNFCVNCLCLPDDADSIYEYSTTYNGDILAAVCDGMGGEADGEIASKLAASLAARITPSASEKEIFNSLRAINIAVSEEAKRIGRLRIGSTIALLSINDNIATVINVGDSRVYRLRKRKLEQLSHDQSEVQSYIDAGLLSEKKARNHPMRHKILQFLGMPDDMLEFEKANVVDVKNEDIFLICSDGLTECLEDKVICKMLRSGASAKELYDAAMKNGGVDNTTVIIVRVE